MSAERPYIDKRHPEVYRAAVKAAEAARTAAREAGLGDDTIEMINIRVSQINACPTCLSVHFPRALKAGVKQSTLDLLPAWREAGVFTDEQKAALLIAESLTVIDPTIDRESVNARAAAHLTTDQISAVEWVATMINAFNRVSIASGHPALKA
ncbi:carboxymuconolactone decarboxylase family protein [Marinitenerispora sediminis]|uniref:Carboxymuconolactone decarboxylase family protein n=1 Tax=Marinitenerispora sediminis TaxID=1931232 RepID=A0A368T3K9_9ACTN|nr:carboxymuconolactone decarboxylase family protein [Marinitenerispora sediminis]RCV49374.1 carboxymuconolactone decarboxylase family protein [Marinitenerispora sediminis]RCV55993.1 carboxymuconolactone decarboxylase family protein [Marinitenerispora sediminis]RCV56608.1 carboxymuconolactone decarboxylase family protein [Marinitenerispora sediminis]